MLGTMAALSHPLGAAGPSSWFRKGESCLHPIILGMGRVFCVPWAMAGPL